MSEGRPNPIVFLLFFLSGATGLIYELVWTRELVFVFGGTTHAISTVLVAFMAGLGLGSFAAGRLGRTLRSPGRVYGLIEIAIGLYAVAIPYMLPFAEPLYKSLYSATSDQQIMLTFIRFAVGALVLAAPTALMGATLPLIVRHVTQSAGDAPRWVGILYGINTLGAVVGTLAGGMLLIPRLGLTATTHTAAGINVAIGVIALMAFRSGASGVLKVRDGRSPSGEHFDSTIAAITPALRQIVLITFALSGFAAMVYQIAWTRALILSIGSSTYSFTCILAAYILGLALGSIAVARWASSLKNPIAAIGAIQVGVGLSAALIQPAFGVIPLLIRDLVSSTAQSFDKLLWLQFAVIVAITIVPTFLMGTLFPLITRVLAATDRDPAAAAGRAYAVNTIGTILGSFLAGFVLLRSEVLGAQASIILAALLNAGLGAWLIRETAPKTPAGQKRVIAPLLAMVAIGGIYGLAGDWDRLYMSAGPFRGRDPGSFKANNNLLYLADGVDLTVAVTEARSDPSLISLIVNAKSDASTALPDMTTQLLQGHLPMLLSPRARRVCIIGLGSGMTVAAVSRYKQVEKIDCIEISEEVIRAHSFFSPYCYDVLTNDPRVRMFRNDGRNHLLLTDETYDVIISEPSNPWIAGIANLFTREYFEICNRRLAEGGVYCLWLQGYTISRDNFRMIGRTLAERFPFVSVWDTSSNDFAMLAGREPFRVALTEVDQRLRAGPVRCDLYRIGAGQPHAVLGRFIAAGPTLLEWLDPRGPIHTDDNALIEFSAPRELYSNDEMAIASALIERTQSPFSDIVVVDASDPAQDAVVKRTLAALNARKLRLQSDLLRGKAPPSEIIRPLLAAMRLDPGNVEVWQRLTQAEEGLQHYYPDFAAREEGQALLKQMEAVRLPTYAENRPCTLPDIVTWLRTTATAAAQRGWFALAVDFLTEAREIAPSDGLLRVEYATALAATGDATGAINELKQALSEKQVNPASLRAAEIPALLRDLPGFEDLVRE